MKSAASVKSIEVSVTRKLMETSIRCRLTKKKFLFCFCFCLYSKVFVVFFTYFSHLPKSFTKIKVSFLIKMYIYQLPFEINKELCRLLDGDDDWKELAGVHMRYSAFDVNVSKSIRVGFSQVKSDSSV